MRTLLSCFLLGILFPVSAEEAAYPEIDSFAEEITGTIFDLRGTRSLKRLRYDGDAFYSLEGEDQSSGSPYDASFVDIGVVRLNFSGPNTGWYFFSPDLKWVTPINASGEVVFQRTDPETATPVRRFPTDLEGAVFETAPDDRSLGEAKLRWTGSVFEFGNKRNGEWQVETFQPARASERVFEVRLQNGSLIWFAFSADGKEAWLLQISGIFGGHSRENPGLASQTADESSLPANLADLANHAEDLKNAGETVRAETLRRRLAQLLSKDPEAARKVDRRLQP